MRKPIHNPIGDIELLATLRKSPWLDVPVRKESRSWGKLGAFLRTLALGLYDLVIFSFGALVSGLLIGWGVGWLIMRF